MKVYSAYNTAIPWRQGEVRGTYTSCDSV